MSYDFNPGAERIAQGVIERWHPHLIGVAIAYITKEAGSEGVESVKTAKPPRGGKALKLGSAASVSEKYQLIATKDFEFIIELNGQYWDRLEMDQQEALIDHELCHCGKDGDGFYIRDHDLEEFRQIVRRHGFWKPDIQAFCEEAQPLFDQPGVQRRFVTRSATDIVVCGGQEVRVEETGDLWTYDVKTESFVRIMESPEQKGVRMGREAADSHFRVNELIDKAAKMQEVLRSNPIPGVEFVSVTVAEVDGKSAAANDEEPRKRKRRTA